MKSYPRPPVGQLKRQFLVNTSDGITDLLIIRVIITFEDDGFVLVTLDFALFDKRDLPLTAMNYATRDTGIGFLCIPDGQTTKRRSHIVVNRKAQRHQIIAVKDA